MNDVISGLAVSTTRAQRRRQAQQRTQLRSLERPRPAVDPTPRIEVTPEGTRSVTMTFPVPLRAWTSNERGHWARKHGRETRLRRDLALLARSARTSLGIPVAAGRREVRLTLIRGYGQGLLDKDQLYCWCKPILDALKVRQSNGRAGGEECSGWIVDDKERWVDYEASQEKDNAVGPAVRITISIPVAESTGGVR